MSNKIKIKSVPFKNNLMTYKDVLNIIGVFPCAVTPGLSYSIHATSDGAKLHISAPGQHVTTLAHCYFDYRIAKPDAGVIYLTWNGKQYSGLLINPALSKMSTVEILSPVHLNTQMQNNVNSHLTKKQKFAWLEKTILTVGAYMPETANAALYRLKVVALSGMDPPEPKGSMDLWIKTYSKAPETTVNKLSSIMRMFAWQAELHMPKEDLNTKIHYGFFPLGNTTRQINKEQYEYLTRIYAPE